MPSRQRSAPRTARGFTLVEVLIALLVLSIGMLGIAALYLESLRASRSALVRTQAVTLAADIGDRIRANRNLVGAYNCGGTCEAGEGGNAIAVDDLNAWRAAVAGQLPGGVGSVAFVAGGGNTPDAYTVTISWTEIGYTSPITYQLRVEI
jgi:type IV pilus assembly protein PilV